MVRTESRPVDDSNDDSIAPGVTPVAEQDINSVRGRLANILLIVIAMASPPTSAISIYAFEVYFGWAPVNVVQHVLLQVIVVLALFRHRLSVGFKIGGTLLIIAFAIVVDVIRFGITGPSIPAIPVVPVLASILFGRRIGLAAVAGVTCGLGLIGVYYVAGQQVPDVVTPEVFYLPLTWIVLVSIAGFWSFVAAFAVGTQTGFFVETINRLSRRERDLREARDEAQAILDNLVDSFFRVDRSLEIVRIAPSAERILGQSSEQLIGQRVCQFATNPDQVTSFLENVMTGEEAAIEARVKGVGHDTEWISLRARPWKDASGAILGVEGLIRDISSERATDRVLRQYRRMEAVGQLSGGIAHDLNNSLAIIVGNIDLLEDEKVNPSVLSGLRKGADMAARLTRRLQEAGTESEGYEQPLQVKALLGEIVSLLRRADIEKIETALELDAGLWPITINDSGFEDAILNLILNARDAMPEGGRILIRARNVPASKLDAETWPDAEWKDYVEVSVSDNGPGIPPELQDRVFETFFTTKGQKKGTGLGLSMVKAFTERAGGQIQLISKVGQGAEVRMLFPRAPKIANVA